MLLGLKYSFHRSQERLFQNSLLENHVVIVQCSTQMFYLKKGKKSIKHSQGVQNFALYFIKVVDIITRYPYQSYCAYK